MRVVEIDKKWGSESNCGGWALQEKSWLVPFGYKKWSNDDVANYMAKEHNLLPVKKRDMVLGKEYIAFRFSDSDFHFMRRNRTGHWTHKQGWSPVTTISQKDVFGEYWKRFGDWYCGHIWLFEVLA